MKIKRGSMLWGMHGSVIQLVFSRSLSSFDLVMSVQKVVAPAQRASGLLKTKNLRRIKIKGFAGG